METNARRCGILLHVSSLPGPYGVGDFGPVARQWVTFLAEHKLTIWQLLPLGPTFSCPYAGDSTFALNPLFVSISDLCEDGFLTEQEACQAFEQPSKKLRSHRVDYETAHGYKQRALRLAFTRLADGCGGTGDFEHFVAEQSHWLNQYATYQSLKTKLNLPWYKWPKPYKYADYLACAEWNQTHPEEFKFHCFAQWILERQWQRLKHHAQTQGVHIVGDLPIYVSHQSADVWAHRNDFELDDQGMPVRVSGVPPDAFSKTGQLWGHPVYNWSHLKDHGFSLWERRFSLHLNRYHHIRVDHFRGFEAYWAVPYSHITAEQGTWVAAPGAELFQRLRGRFPQLSVWAEDLGVITPGVEQLRDTHGFFGHLVAQFGFGAPPFSGDESHRPHGAKIGHVAFTGTHDNAPLACWLKEGGGKVTKELAAYLGVARRSDCHHELMRALMMSAASFVIFPAQDVLKLGSEARMNTPGTPDGPRGNWTWRMPPLDVQRGLWQPLKNWSILYGRSNP